MAGTWTLTFLLMILKYHSSSSSYIVDEENSVLGPGVLNLTEEEDDATVEDTITAVKENSDTEALSTDVTETESSEAYPKTTTQKYTETVPGQTNKEDNSTNIKEECPIFEVNMGMYHCMEIGCTLGMECVSEEEVKGQTCCAHIVDRITVNCCLKKKQKHELTKEILQELHACPPVKLPPSRYHCLEMGCKEGDPCKTEGLEYETCCPHESNGQRFTCCLGRTMPSPKNKTKALSPELKCPSTPVEPSSPTCPEIGCSVGGKCATQQFEGHPCCNFHVANVQATCCLSNADLVADDATEEPTGSTTEQEKTTQDKLSSISSTTETEETREATTEMEETQQPTTEMEETQEPTTKTSTTFEATESTTGISEEETKATTVVEPFDSTTVEITAQDRLTFDDEDVLPTEVIKTNKDDEGNGGGILIDESDVEDIPTSEDPDALDITKGQETTTKREFTHPKETTFVTEGTTTAAKVPSTSIKPHDMDSTGPKPIELDIIHKEFLPYSKEEVYFRWLMDLIHNSGHFKIKDTVTETSVATETPTRSPRKSKKKKVKKPSKKTSTPSSKVKHKTTAKPNGCCKQSDTDEEAEEKGEAHPKRRTYKKRIKTRTKIRRVFRRKFRTQKPPVVKCAYITQDGKCLVLAKKPTVLNPERNSYRRSGVNMGNSEYYQYQPVNPQPNVYQVLQYPYYNNPMGPRYPQQSMAVVPQHLPRPPPPPPLPPQMTEQERGCAISLLKNLKNWFSPTMPPDVAGVSSNTGGCPSRERKHLSPSFWGWIKDKFKAFYNLINPIHREKREHNETSRLQRNSSIL